MQRRGDGEVGIGAAHLQRISSVCFTRLEDFSFLLFVEFPSETKEGFPLTAERQWQHQPKASRFPYRAQNLTKYKLAVCRLTQGWK